MKSFSKIIFVIAISLSLISCEENFSPKTDFKDEYVMNGIIEADAMADSYIQYISISRVYDVDGLNPYLNKTDPAILGAEIILKQNKKNYDCLQDTIKRLDTSRYNSPYIYYASPPIQVNGNDEFLITVNLPNGKILSGYTRVPHPFEPTFSYPFNSGITTRINRFLWGNSWQITWEVYGNDLYFPKLLILYEKKNDSTYTPGTKEIPMKYVNKNGSIKAVYPDYINGNSITYEFDAIDSAMAQISEGDQDKKNYRIISIIFEMLEFDQELSKYYASTHGYLDNFSIRLDETIYSNVNGGIGIIGSKLQTNLRFEVNHSYISLFGYTY